MTSFRFLRRLSLILVVFLPAFALADLQVFPTRVLLDDQTKTAQVSVRHRGEKPMRYRIKPVFYKMKPDGTMELIDDPGRAAGSAAGLFRFSPQQVLLAPNVEQVVRIMARKPADLPEGDYHIHLHFEGLDEGNEATQEATAADGTKMVLKAKMAVAIPVIVRQGHPPQKVELDHLKLVTLPDRKPGFELRLRKPGSSVAFGDLEVTFTPTNGKSKTVSMARGVSSYIESRTMTYPFTEAVAGGGTLKAEFREANGTDQGLITSTTTILK